MSRKTRLWAMLSVLALASSWQPSCRRCESPRPLGEELCLSREWNGRILAGSEVAVLLNSVRQLVGWRSYWATEGSEIRIDATQPEAPQVQDVVRVLHLVGFKGAINPPPQWERFTRDDLPDSWPSLPEELETSRPEVFKAVVWRSGSNADRILQPAWEFAQWLGALSGGKGKTAIHAMRRANLKKVLALVFMLERLGVEGVVMPRRASSSDRGSPTPV